MANKSVDPYEIVTKGANKYTIITICNYDSYQVEEDDEGQTEGEQRASERATTKEYKKDINKEINKEREEDVKKSLKEFGNTLLKEMPQRCQAIMMKKNLSWQNCIC